MGQKNKNINKLINIGNRQVIQVLRNFKFYQTFQPRPSQKSIIFFFQNHLQRL
jgi:hypothetical protein